LRQSSRRFVYLLAVVLLIGGLFPLFVYRDASAAGQLLTRSLTLNTAVPSATAQYKFTFTVAATSTVQSLKFQACTVAVGTCGTVTGISFSSAAWVSQNNWQGATNFVKGAGSNDCTGSATVLCANRTDATNQTATARDITFGTITNPSTVNTAFFIRITTYSDNAYTAGNIQDTGTVAAAIVQTLTVSAAVAEVLNFCTGATTVNDATTSVGATCANVSGTGLNIGTLDTSVTNVSPNSSNGGDGNNGVAMLRTNATSGATIDVVAIQQSGTEHLGTLRISGATCNATDTDYTDQCIRAQGTTQATFNADGTTERFGMTIAGVNCGSVSAYECIFTSSSNKLTRDAAYDGNGGATYVTDTATVSGATDGGYTWDDTGATDRIASSSTVVDDEALILKFAAYPAITTPFGAYTAQASFIAVATY